MKLIFATLFFISSLALASEIKLKETGVGSGSTAGSACFAAEGDAKGRAHVRCQGEITDGYCSKSESRFGNSFNCIAICEYVCKTN